MTLQKKKIARNHTLSAIIINDILADTGGLRREVLLAQGVDKVANRTRLKLSKSL